MTFESGRWAGVAAGVAFATLAGCETTMIPTPYVMVGDAGRKAYAEVSPEMRTPEIPVLYVTDRAADGQDEHGPRYGYRRSNQLAFGTATVSYSPTPTWEELVEASTTEKRERDYVPSVSRIEELGHFAPTSDRMEVKDGVLVRRADAAEGWRAEQEAFCAAVDRFARATSRKEAIVFVHGYNNQFHHAVIRLAEAWHFGGRAGIPIVYTWPAGSGGLKGYAYDRESGEFTIVHLKLLLWALADCPSIEKVHIVSHSRGTDVATTALRELNAEVRGSYPDGPFARRIYKGRESLLKDAPPGPDMHDVFKIETLVLAAPDLDVEVFAQRFMGENLLRGARRTVLYFSKEDSALGMADWLFRSRRRLGAIQIGDFDERARSRIAHLNNLQVINCEVTGHTSHSYILQHPAALSDLLLLLRDQKPPGAENGRPLKPVGDSIWTLDNSYLKPPQD